MEEYGKEMAIQKVEFQKDLEKAKTANNEVNQDLKN
jgi:hypothetical protein